MSYKHVEHIDPYTPKSGAMVPLGVQKFLRTCLLWQAVRFAVINVRMTILILKSHH